MNSMIKPIALLSFALIFGSTHAQQSAAEEWKNEIRKVYQLVDKEIFTPRQGEMVLKDIKDAARTDLERQLLGNGNDDERHYVVVFWGKTSEGGKIMMIHDTVADGSVQSQLNLYFNDVESGYVKRQVIYKPSQDETVQEKSYVAIHQSNPPVFDNKYFVEVSSKGKVKGRSHKISISQLTNADGLTRLTDSLETAIKAELGSKAGDIKLTTKVDTQFTIFGGDIPERYLNDPALYAVAINVFGEGYKGWIIRRDFSVTNGGVFAVTLAEADSILNTYLYNVRKELNERGGKPKNIEISGILHVKEALVEPADGSDLSTVFQEASELQAFNYPSRRLKSKKDLRTDLGDELASQIHNEYKNDISRQVEKALGDIDNALLDLEETLKVFDDNEYYSVLSIEKRKKDSPTSVYFLLGSGFSNLALGPYGQMFAENNQRLFNISGYIGLRGELNLSKRWYLSSELRYSTYRHRFRRNNYFTVVDDETAFVRSDESLERSSFASNYFDVQLGIGFRNKSSFFADAFEIGVYGGAHTRSTSRRRFKDEAGYTIREMQRGSFDINPYRYGFYFSMSLDDVIHNRIMIDANSYFSSWDGPELHIVSYALMVCF